MNFNILYTIKESNSHSPIISTQDLLLDSEIRDWVFLPLLVMLVIAGIIRHYIGIMLRMQNSKTIPYQENRIINLITRASILRNVGADILSDEKWKGRMAYLIDKDKGFLRNEIEKIIMQKDNQKKNENSSNIKDVHLPDPMTMLGPMKGQFLVMLQNMILMHGISYLFQGYILVKVPFFLSNGFKHMFQRGLDISNLDTSYVSSISWYFLVMFGLRGFFTLIIGDNVQLGQEINESLMLHRKIGLSTNNINQPCQQYDPLAALKAEIENLEVAFSFGRVANSEKKILGNRKPY